MELKIPHNLEPSELDMLCELLPEFFNSQTLGPRFRELDWNEEFKKDILTGKGFIVKSKPFKKRIKDKDGNLISRGIKNKYGIHSPLFGSDWQDDNAFAERYSCECKETIGRVFEGKRCPKCGKKVKFVDVDLKMFAWLRINVPEFKLIHPLMYKMIDSYFGKDVLLNIINFKQDMTLDGAYKPKDGIDFTKHPFYGIGMVEFYKRFDEILKFYSKKNKNRNKEATYQHILENKHKIFTNSVPVYSSVLRQVFFTEEDYSYTKIDKCYNAMFGNFLRLNEETGLNDLNIAKINKNLFRAQLNLNTAFELIFNSITEKEGLIRRNILGGRINFSARTVIVPNPKLRSYEVELPYVCFVEMFKDQIINLLVKMEGCTFNTAVRQWFDGYRDFDPKIYKVIQYILKHSKHKCRTLLNRNPTINFGSFMSMEIASVKTDYNDLSLGIPIACLSSLNADFDGKLIASHMSNYVG